MQSLNKMQPLEMRDLEEAMGIGIKTAVGVVEFIEKE